MESEALRGIRTLRQVNTGLDIGRRRRPRSTNSLSRTKAETKHLESLADRRLEQVLAKERRRVAAQEAFVEKSRQRLLKSRDKLAATINRNRALTELRQSLQSARWKGEASALNQPAKSTPGLGLRPMKLSY